MREKLAISFTIASKTMKYFEINLTKKKMKNLFIKNYKTQMKVTEEDKNNCRYHMLLNQKN